MQFERIENVHMHVLRRMVRDGMSKKSSLDEIKKAKEAMNGGKEEEEMIRINWGCKHTKKIFSPYVVQKNHTNSLKKNER